MHRILSSCFFITALAACGSPYDGLFTRSADPSATPNSIYGVWAAQEPTSFGVLDVRIELTSGSMTFANRCEFPDGSRLIAGVTVPVAYTSTSIVVQGSAV